MMIFDWANAHPDYALGGMLPSGWSFTIKYVIAAITLLLASHRKASPSLSQ